MKLKIEKELFQWEKNREVFVEGDTNGSVTCLQFYNKKSRVSQTKEVVDGKALIPNSLLKENLPITVLACQSVQGETHVILRREFKVLYRVKPEEYIDEDTVIDIIYDGGVEV